MIRKLILNIKLFYYTLLERFDDYEINRSPDQVIVQSRQNVKLMRGVKKLVRRLRSMNPAERTVHENLLGQEPYKKTAKEVREELEVRHKVLSNPKVQTEDELVMKVVSKAPIYAKEQEVSELRKALTACLKASAADPSNGEHAKEAIRLKAKLKALRVEIERMKNG